MIALGFGSGLFRKGPGTAGSLVAFPFLVLILELNISLQWLFLITLFFIGIYSADITSKNLNQKDPSCIVIDEIVGLLMLFLLIPLNLKNIFLAFILFRFFDIYKPFPISLAEKKFKNSFGIMFDDILAALLSLITIKIINYVF